MLRSLLSRMLSAGRSALLVAIVVILAMAASTARAQRSIPDDNLGYPVLVQIPDVDEASGFYLDTATSVYFVTAKHVLFNMTSGQLLGNKANLLSYSRDPSESGRNLAEVDLAGLFARGEVSKHPTADVAVIRVATLSPAPDAPNDPKKKIMIPLPGVTFSESAPSGILAVAFDAVKKFSDVLVANQVFMFGYPTSLGLREQPQLDPLRPLLRSGIIAGLNPTSKSLVIDCASYPGNSGGPIVEVDHQAFGERLSVIGVVREFVPFDSRKLHLPPGFTNTILTNSGYTLATPMDFVLELVK